jgi:hypothetical protein
MTTAQISHGRFSPLVFALLRIKFRRKSSPVAFQTQATLSRSDANFDAGTPFQAAKKRPGHLLGNSFGVVRPSQALPAKIDPFKIDPRLPDQPLFGLIRYFSPVARLA